MNASTTDGSRDDVGDVRERELNARIEAYPELLLLAQSWNPETGIMEFFDGEDVHVRASATAIGSWGRSGSWRWAWANESLPTEARRAARRVKELAPRDAVFLEKNAFPASSAEARNLVATACHLLDAPGVCNLKAEQAVWWFALDDIEHLRPLDTLVPRAEETVAEVLMNGHSVRIVNALRARFPGLRPALIGRDLRGAPQPWAHDLHAQLLFDSGFMETHEARDFSGIDLSYSRLDDSTLRGMVLRAATFEGASLVDTDFSRADLRGASFAGAFLNGANFNRARLAGADFTGAELSRTLLTDVDLSEVKGLDAVHHMMPSEISLSTLTASHFRVSPAFLRRAGVSRGLIEDLANGQRFARQYETCFLSYSSKDRPFAERLYQSMEGAGVRVFWDRFDVLPGESLRDQIVEAIREHDRLIVVLSENAFASDWVRQEIELAWYHKRESLVPIRLCDIEAVRTWTAAHETLPDLAGLFPILDFSGWHDDAEYAHALSLLLRSLAGGADLQTSHTSRDNEELSAAADPGLSPDA